MLADPRLAVRSAAASGVTDIITIGIDIASSRSAVIFSRELDGVHAAIGIHPHGAASLTLEHMDELAALAADENVVAVGETGLDYYRDRSPRESQLEAFRMHIELARSTGLPLIVHSRDAAADTLAVLREEADDLTIVLHCFALTAQVEECVARGYYISFAGNITFANAKELRGCVSAIPPGLILTETDSPYLAPAPRRGESNEPANVIHVLEALASLKGMDAGELRQAINANFRRAFPAIR